MLLIPSANNFQGYGLNWTGCFKKGGRWFTFPQGESQDGSPGLEAFHRAKSFWDFFSLSRSAEMLRSPRDRISISEKI